MKKNLLICFALMAFSTLQAGASADYDRPNQYGSPFSALAGLELSGQDYYYTKGGVTNKIGDVKYTYNEYGNQIGSVLTLRNVDGILWDMYSVDESILPLDVVCVQEYLYTEDLEESYSYYLDAQGRRHDISSYKRVAYNGETIFMEYRELDEDGNWVIDYERGRVESEFDAQNRPVQTISYYSSHETNPYTGKDSLVVTPSYRVEYEYPAEGLITKITSNSRTSVTGAVTWEYSYKTTRGTTSDGESYYESLYYNRYDTAWVGNDKYTSKRTETANGTEYTQKRWSWNYGTKSWELSGKDVTLYNSNDDMLSRDSYKYVDTVSTFFLVEQDGREYSGDTLCAEWYIYYNLPGDTPVENQLELASYGDKTEFKDYTDQELGLPEEHYYSLPRKYEINYRLDLENKSEVSWIPVEKKNYEYDTRHVSRYESPRNLTTQIYAWNGSEWVLSGGETLDYNEEGDKILEERSRNGKVVERRVTLYDYREVYYKWGNEVDTSMERLTMREEYWSIVGDSTLACTQYSEYDYDDNNNRILSIECSGWSSYYNTWSYGYKQEVAYDEDGNDTLSASYNWYAEKKVWVGNSKVIRVGDSSGEEPGAGKDLSYYGGLDDDDNPIWIPQRFVFWNDTVDASGNYTHTSEQFNTWNTSTNSWDDGFKRETTYNPEGLKIRERGAFMDWEGTGDWQDYYYDQQITYDSEGRMIEDADIDSKIKYTYLPTGETKDTYFYMLQNDEWVMTSKTIATVVDGWITEYNDSVFGYYDYDLDRHVDAWVPAYRTVFTRDETTGLITGITKRYDNGLWVNSQKEVGILDELHRPLMRESYNWRESYDSEDGEWVGDNKVELAYGPNGNRVMYATYTWNEYDSAWEGDEKSEQDIDPVTGETTMYAEYYWSWEKKDWSGSYKYEQQRDSLGNILYEAEYDWDYYKWGWTGSRKEEHEYNAEGKQIMSAYYYSTDSLGNWIGDHKSVSYSEDNVSYYEYYNWNSFKNDWQGEDRSEFCNDDNYRMRAYYEWDDDDWCWVGDEKIESTRSENSVTTINYEWDKATADWVKTTKDVEENLDIDEYNNKEITTTSKWEDGQWKNFSRVTQAMHWRNDWNLDYKLVTTELYSGSSWVENMSLKLVYVYSALTGVEEIASDAALDVNISVNDGSIIVSAADDSLIRVLNASGANIAAGRGSVTASVVSGIYLINANGKTIKVLVK